MKQLYMYLLKPYTIHDDTDGSDTEVRGDIYVGAMPEGDESVCCAWFTDSESGCAGTVIVTRESLEREVERFCPITFGCSFEKMEAFLDSIQKEAVDIATAQSARPRDSAAQISILCAEARQTIRNICQK